MAKVKLICGKIGSGKSWYARRSIAAFGGLLFKGLAGFEEDVYKRQHQHRPDRHFSLGGRFVRQTESQPHIRFIRLCEAALFRPDHDGCPTMLDTTFRAVMASNPARLRKMCIRDSPIYIGRWTQCLLASAGGPTAKSPGP